MKKLLEEQRIFIFVEHLFEEMEVFYPRYRLILLHGIMETIWLCASEEIKLP